MADLFGTYGKRIKLTIDNSKVDADVSWFPVTVFFTSAQAEEIFSEFDADSDYMKCAFTKADGVTQLYGEMELFDVSENKAIYHVSLDGWAISSSAPTDFYFYYDNLAADNTTYIGAVNTTPGAAVWDTNFKMVQHMADATTSTVLDSTSNNNDGTKKGANEPVQAAGKVGLAQDFDGTNDYISTLLGSMPLANDAKTISFIVKGDANNKYYGAISTRVDIGGIDNSAKGYITIIDESAGGRMLYSHTGKGDYIANPDLSFGNWYMYSATTGANAATPLLYLDGAAQLPTTNTLAAANAENSNGYLVLGRQIASYSDGSKDEVRISSVARTAGWIKATYNSLWDTLLTYGSEEIGGEPPSGLSIPIAMYHYMHH